MQQHKILISFVLGYKYFKIRREKENYRIFTNQQRMSGSVSSLADAVANEAPMAYENPSFSAEPGNADFLFHTLSSYIYLKEIQYSMHCHFRNISEPS